MSIRVPLSCNPLTWPGFKRYRDIKKDRQRASAIPAWFLSTIYKVYSWDGIRVQVTAMKPFRLVPVPMANPPAGNGFWRIKMGRHGARWRNWMNWSSNYFPSLAQLGAGLLPTKKKTKIACKGNPKQLSHSPLCPKRNSLLLKSPSLYANSTTVFSSIYEGKQWF